MQAINRIYSGKASCFCMCGCGGKYYDPTHRSFKRVVNTFLTQPNIVVDEKNGWAEAVVGERFYVAYFK
jgi:hypothetical protein